MAEAVMMGLAPYIGRQDAHDVVYDACRIVNEQGGRLADVLNAMPSVSERLDPQLIEKLTAALFKVGLSAADKEAISVEYFYADCRTNLRCD